MTFHETKLTGVFEISLNLHSDDRGFFARSWCQKEFENGPESESRAVQRFL